MIKINIKTLHKINFFMLILLISSIIFFFTYPIEWKIDAWGNVFPDKYYDVKSGVEGIIKDIYFDYGDYLNEGDIITKIYDHEYDKDQNVIIDKYNFVKKKLNSLNEMYSKGLVAQNEVIELNNELLSLEFEIKRLKDYDILSPINGFIIYPLELKKRKGDFVNKGDIIATVSDSSEMIIKINIEEKRIKDIEAGQDVLIFLDVYPVTKYKPIKGFLYKVSQKSIIINNKVFYEALVKINYEKSNKALKNINLTTGMSSRVKISIKKCSIFNYLIYEKIKGVK